LSSNPRIAAFIALLGLAGCGFTPLYGGSAGQDVSAQLGQVAVSNIPERPGQMLRMSLQTKLQAGNAPVTEIYALNVNYVIVTNDLGVLQDSATTRFQLTATADWSLSPIGNPQHPLTKGSATSMDAGNVVNGQYFAVDMETDTINQQLADTVAAEITSQLAAWFHAHPNA
jgi:LPS-assembly lipoprotein